MKNPKRVFKDEVRPTEEYRSGHIAGDISLPLHELKDRLAELPRDQDIVAYCRGPYCVFAAQAVECCRSTAFVWHDWKTAWRTGARTVFPSL